LQAYHKRFSSNNTDGSVLCLCAFHRHKYETSKFVIRSYV